VCIYKSKCVCVCVCVYKSNCLCVYIRVNVCVCVYKSNCLCVYIRVNVCVCAYFSYSFSFFFFSFKGKTKDTILHLRNNISSQALPRHRLGKKQKCKNSIRDVAARCISCKCRLQFLLRILSLTRSCTAIAHWLNK